MRSESTYKGFRIVTQETPEGWVFDVYNGDLDMIEGGYLYESRREAEVDAQNEIEAMIARYAEGR